jgi:2-polyprenyl-6-hydroxyphenyl methylase/3-demethylubiquinone-9 3-methyltransferase
MVPGLLFKLERARLHHLGAEARQFEHLVVGNLLELLRVRHDARVGGVNAVHVRVNLAEVGLERGGKRNRRQIRTAAAQRRDLAFRRLALEAGHDDDIARFEQFVDFLRRDVVNPGLGMNHVGDDARLRAGERHRGHVQRVQRHGRERDGLLFTGGKQHVHFALAGQRHDFLGQLDQVVCHAAHRGNNDDDLIAPGAIFSHARRDIFDAVGVADRRAAVFLND